MKRSLDGHRSVSFSAGQITLLLWGWLANYTRPPLVKYLFMTSCWLLLYVLPRSVFVGTTIAHKLSNALQKWDFFVAANAVNDGKQCKWHTFDAGADNERSSWHSFAAPINTNNQSGMHWTNWWRWRRWAAVERYTIGGHQWIRL